MIEKEIKDLIYHGSEERNLEYKQSIDWNDAEIKAKITKSILAMSNIRDGGFIIIGVKEKGSTFDPEGISEKHLDSFIEDDVKDFVSNYADPYVQFHLKKVDDQGKFFIVIQVREFEESPVICKRGREPILRKGSLYTRSRRKPESIEVPSQAEMREIVELAVEKGIRKYRSQLRRAGIIQTEAERPSDDARFAEEVGFLRDRTGIAKKIRSFGFWQVKIRPTKFEKEKIKRLPQCKEIVRSSVVRLRRWSYPHFGPHNPVSKLNWVESTVDSSEFIELWRFFQSGQFVHLFAYREDLGPPDPETTGSFGPQIKSNKFLSILETLYTNTEIFEFAVRLAEKNVFDTSLEMSIKLCDTNNRQLFFWNPMRHLNNAYVCECDTILFEKSYQVNELMAKASELALGATVWIFERFNWDQTPRKMLEEEQRKLLERRL